MRRRHRCPHARVLVAAIAVTGAATLAGCDDGDGLPTSASDDSTVTSDVATTAGPDDTWSAPSGTDGDTDDTTTAPDDTGGDGRGSEGSEGSEGNGGGTVVYGTAREFRSLNNNLAGTRSPHNGVVTGAVLPDAMPFDPVEGAHVADRHLMRSVRLTSRDPQIIEYVVHPDAAWSDGEPIDCDDWYLQWIAANGTLVELRRNGRPKVDPATGEPLQLFKPASTAGYEDIARLRCSDDGKTITARFDRPFPAWRSLFNDLVPAHVVERAAGVDDLIDAYDDADRDALISLAKQYTTIFTPTDGRLDPDVFLSGDAFALGEWVPGESLELVRNEHYWGPPAKLDSVVVKQVPEEQQLQAIANDEIDVLDRWPEEDLLANLEDLENIVTETGRQRRWDHFVFNLRADSPFADRRVRQAFALCLPRHHLLSAIVKPLLNNSNLLNNRLIRDHEPGYRDTSGGVYDLPDIAEAKRLLRRADVRTPVNVRLGWNLDSRDLRRKYQVTATIRSCRRAGFEVEDVGEPSFVRDSLADGESWDVAMLARPADASPAVAADAYVTDGADNVGRYSNEAVDELLMQLSRELDDKRAVTIANRADELMWKDLPTVPLYSRPALAAWNARVQGVLLNPGPNGILWNADMWSVVD